MRTAGLWALRACAATAAWTLGAGDLSWEELQSLALSLEAAAAPEPAAALCDSAALASHRFAPA